MAAGDSAGDRDDRRRTALWLWLLLVIAILVFLFAVCAGGSDEETPAAQTTTTAPPAQAAPTSPQPTSAVTTAAPARTPEPPAATPTTGPPVAATVPPTTEAGPIDISGTWSFHVDVTVATGACEGEEDDEVDPDTVVIAQEGTMLTVTGLSGEGPAWSGEINGGVAGFGGQRAEDAGTTTASFIMMVDDEATAMTGIEEWTWSGPGGSCPDSLSEVTATKVG